MKKHALNWIMPWMVAGAPACTHFEEDLAPVITHGTRAGSGEVCSLVFVTNSMRSYTVKPFADGSPGAISVVFDHAHQVGIENPRMSYALSARGEKVFESSTALGRSVKFGETFSLEVPYAPTNSRSDQYARFEIPIFPILMEIQRNGKPTGKTFTWKNALGDPWFKIREEQTACDVIHLYKIEGRDLTKEGKNGESRPAHTSVKAYKKKWNDGEFVVTQYDLPAKDGAGRVVDLATVNEEITEWFAKTGSLELAARTAADTVRNGVPTSKLAAFEQARRLISAEIHGKQIGEVRGLSEVFADFVLKSP